MDTLTLKFGPAIIPLSRSLTKESVVAISFDENSTGKTFADTKVHPVCILQAVNRRSSYDHLPSGNW